MHCWIRLQGCSGTKCVKTLLAKTLLGFNEFFELLLFWWCDGEEFTSSYHFTCLRKMLVVFSFGATNFTSSPPLPLPSIDFLLRWFIIECFSTSTHSQFPLLFNFFWEWWFTFTSFLGCLTINLSWCTPTHQVVSPYASTS